MIRTLREHDGTPLVALDRDELQMDGILPEDEDESVDQLMHIKRMSEGAWLIRPVVDGGPPDLGPLRDLYES